MPIPLNELLSEMRRVLGEGRELPVGTRRVHGGREVVKTHDGWVADTRGRKGPTVDDAIAFQERHKDRGQEAYEKHLGAMHLAGHMSAADLGRHHADLEHEHGKAFKAVRKQIDAHGPYSDLDARPDHPLAKARAHEYRLGSAREATRRAHTDATLRERHARWRKKHGPVIQHDDHPPMWGRYSND